MKGTFFLVRFLRPSSNRYLFTLYALVQPAGRAKSKKFTHTESVDRAMSAKTSSYSRKWHEAQKPRLTHPLIVVIGIFSFLHFRAVIKSIPRWAVSPGTAGV